MADHWGTTGPTVTDQLKVWQGEFGKLYTDRNVVDYHCRLPAFQRILNGLPIRRVLEVGCNRGHNLIALAEILAVDTELVGIEPNGYALELARASSTKIGVLSGSISDLPFNDGYFDLVFTANVLIHVSLQNLAPALNEIYRVGNRYILVIEYFAEEETPICYRGRDDLLWKRDFLKHYTTQFCDLALVRSGYLTSEDGFDRSHWWLLQKQA